MRKKILAIVFCCISLFLIAGCGKEKVKSDALRFQKEYESLNGTVNTSGKERRSVSIPSNNPYVYTTAEEIIKKIENQETFYVYFGSSYCPWCRSVIEKSIEVANNYSIDTIYYVNIWEGDHQEILRDTYKLDEKGNVVLESEGAKEYQTLLTYLSSVLEDYTLTDSNGKEIKVGEKRIFAPNFIYIEKGSAKRITTGQSPKQTSSSMELSEEILKDEEDLFQTFFNEENTCIDNC